MNCGDTYQLENQDTGWTTAFSNAASSFPGIGAVFGSLAQPSYSLGQIKCVPGNKYDTRSGYDLEGKIAMLGVALVVAYIVLALFKK